MDAILHIGIGKAGSSSIEEALRLNAGLLPAAGAWRPESLSAGGARHIKLAAYGQDDAVMTQMRISAGVEPGRLAAFREQVRAELAAEIEAAPPARLALLCDVGCCSLVSAEETARLHALLSGLFDRVRVLIYLRRQDEQALSRFQQDIKAGSVSRRLLPETPYNDYDRLIEAWAAGFGRDNLIVRLYEPHTWLEGDILDDMFAAIGLKPPTGFRRPARLNPRLSADAQRLLLAFNRRIGREGAAAARPARQRLVARLAETCPGEGLKPARAAARRFLNRFSDSNERVRSNWFPDRNALFPDEFSAYPETVPDPGEDAAGAARAARRLLMEGGAGDEALDARLRHFAALADDPEQAVETE